VRCCRRRDASIAHVDLSRPGCLRYHISVRLRRFARSVQVLAIPGCRRSPPDPPASSQVPLDGETQASMLWTASTKSMFEERQIGSVGAQAMSALL
jgi:hypothetical protein